MYNKYSRSNWKCILGLKKHMIFVCLYTLLSCMPCFYACTRVCFHQLSNVRIVRTFKNRITIQLFEKWRNISCCYISYIKSETSDIWRTGVWFLKPFKGRNEENHIYDLVKPNSAKKVEQYRGCNICYQAFFGKWKNWL